ncbi:hypothetical protein J8273_3650 [Carpediemonas membranifera]|uniref:Uncharacterized protein n=1 Tax=Carpediemonas membranifera TaxID=201153 RepID=A0A8J6AUR1_9EUKA|nr:hypothetical protein J8273_3650 [Carpediemonas membranifera]|eukprot:KAG9394678.1 hypothetical protein J8273_3650 [Carpediemonas membranifera]
MLLLRFVLALSPSSPPYYAEGLSIRLITWSVNQSTAIDVSRLTIGLSDVHAFTLVPHVTVVAADLPRDVEYGITSLPNTTVHHCATIDALVPALSAAVIESTEDVVVVLDPAHIPTGSVSARPFSLAGIHMMPGHRHFVVAVGPEAKQTLAQAIGVTRLPLRPLDSVDPALRDWNLLTSDVQVIDGHAFYGGDYGGWFAPRTTFVYPGPHMDTPQPAGPPHYSRFNDSLTPMQRALHAHRMRLDDRFASLDWVGSVVCDNGDGPGRVAFVWYFPYGSAATVARYTRMALLSAFSLRSTTDVRLLFAFQDSHIESDAESLAVMADMGVEYVIIPDKIDRDFIDSMNPLLDKFKLIMERLNVVKINRYLPPERQLDKIATLDADIAAVEDPTRIFCHPSAFYGIMEREQDWIFNGGLAVYDLNQINPDEFVDDIVSFGKDPASPCLFDRMWAVSDQELISCYFMNRKRNIPLLGNNMCQQVVDLPDLGALYYNRYRDNLLIHRNGGTGLYHYVPALKRRLALYWPAELAQCVNGYSTTGNVLIDRMEPGVCDRCRCVGRGVGREDHSWAAFWARNSVGLRHDPALVYRADLHPQLSPRGLVAVGG